MRKILVLLMMIFSLNAAAFDMSDVVEGFWSIYSSQTKSWSAMKSNLKLMDKTLTSYKAKKTVAEKEFLLAKAYNVLKANFATVPKFLKPSFKALMRDVQLLRLHNKYRFIEKERALFNKINSNFDYLRIFL